MKRPPPGLPYIPAECYEALDVFTNEELSILHSWYDKDTGVFQCIGFMNPLTGRIAKWANPEKYKALEVLEDQVRKECPVLVPFL